MAGFRDDFYYRVGRDYHEHMESSFIYGYVRREREQNLRLKINRERRTFLSCRHTAEQG